MFDSRGLRASETMHTEAVTVLGAGVSSCVYLDELDFEISCV